MSKLFNIGSVLTVLIFLIAIIGGGQVIKLGHEKEGIQDYDIRSELDGMFSDYEDNDPQTSIDYFVQFCLVTSKNVIITLAEFGYNHPRPGVLGLMKPLIYTLYTYLTVIVLYAMVPVFAAGVFLFRLYQKKERLSDGA